MKLQMRKQVQEGRRLVIMTETVFKLKFDSTLSWYFVLLYFPLIESAVGLMILFWFETYRSKLKNGSLFYLMVFDDSVLLQSDSRKGDCPQSHP